MIWSTFSKLALIFVKPLDLHVENSVGVQGHTLSFPGVAANFTLFCRLISSRR